MGDGSVPRARRAGSWRHGGVLARRSGGAPAAFLPAGRCSPAAWLCGRAV